MAGASDKGFDGIFLAPIEDLQASDDDRLFELYEVQKNDTFSEMLFQRGLGRKGSLHQIYGKQGYLNKNQQLNPRIKKWGSLDIGERVIISFSKSDFEKFFDSKKSTTDSKVLSPINPQNLDQVNSDFVYEIYQVKKGETLSGILFDRGLGRGNKQDPLYGSRGWVDKNKEINPRLKDWRLLQIGETVALKYPKHIFEKAYQQDRLAAVAQKSESSTSIDLIPEIELEPIALSSLLGFRYGRVLSFDNSSVTKKLISKVSFINIFFEFRSTFLKGLRIYYDYVPKIEQKYYEDKLKFSLNRAMVSKEFDWNLQNIVDQVKIIPKVGYYSIDSRLPSKLGEDGKLILNDIKVTNALGLGMEVNLEFHHQSNKFRLWASQENDANMIGIKQDSRLSSTRLGGDIFWGGLEEDSEDSSLDTMFLLYAGYESVKIGKGNFDVQLKYPFAGLGLGVYW